MSECIVVRQNDPLSATCQDSNSIYHKDTCGFGENLIAKPCRPCEPASSSSPRPRRYQQPVPLPSPSGLWSGGGDAVLRFQSGSSLARYYVILTILKPTKKKSHLIFRGAKAKSQFLLAGGGSGRLGWECILLGCCKASDEVDSPRMNPA